jgi:hypothetical protein
MQARQMLMGLTSLAKGMGMTDKAAVALSGEFSKMAVDIGSFMMKDPDHVMGAFQSALMGNTMALRSYGVYLNETLLKETAAENAKKGMVFFCERQARAYAVLTETQKQQADAIGDYAVEAGNFGNQLKKFYGGLSELPARFGKGLLEPANEFLKVANKMIDQLRSLDDATWQTISTLTALGTAAGLSLGAYRIGTTAIGFYTAARHAATAATAGNTVALGSNTGALAVNNAAARTINASAAVRRLPTVVSPLPHQDRRNVWEQQAAVLRESHSRVNRDIAAAVAARDAASHRYTTTGDVRYLDLATRATTRIHDGTRRRDNLERHMQSLRDAQRRNPLNLTAAQSRERRAVMRQNVLRNRGRVRYNRAVETFHRRAGRFGGRNSPLGLVGRGMGGMARSVGNATGLTYLLRSFGTMVMRWLPVTARTWGGVMLRSVAAALLPIGGTVLAILNPVGWAAAILTGIAAVGNYLPTLMYKAYDGFVSLFSPENMSKIWDWFKQAGWSTLEWLVSGLQGLGHVTESIFWTAVNALGNGLRRMIQGLTLGAVDIGNFEYKSSGYAAYESQKKLDEMEAKRSGRLEEQHKIAKRIAEMRQSVVEQERKWLEQEKLMLKKRSEFAAGRLDTTAKAESLTMELPFSETLSGLAGAAVENLKGSLANVQEKLEAAAQEKGRKQIRFDEASAEFDKANSEVLKWQEQCVKAQVDGVQGERLEQIGTHYRDAQGRRKAALNERRQAQQDLDASGLSLDTIQGRMDSLMAQQSFAMNDKENYAGRSAEQRYALFDARFENIGKLKGFRGQRSGYESLLSELQNNPMVRQQRDIEAAVVESHLELAQKRRELNRTLAYGDDVQAAAWRSEVESAEKRITQAQAAYHELQANVADQRKIREKLDTLVEEQNKRHQEAQKNLWDFNFDHASQSKQQAMARRGFFNAHNQFEGARTDEEREQALQDTQSMYGKLAQRADEMPVWNGFLSTAAGAVESNSVAAQEMQERVLNDFNKVMMNNTIRQTVLLEILRTALEQVAKNTDPNQQPFVGGTT